MEALPQNFWKLAQVREFPTETENYIPKLIAALIIAKAPGLYGFRNLNPQAPVKYEYFHVPGGTDLFNLAGYLKMNTKNLRYLNPELVHGFVPGFVKSHRIRIPKGSTTKVSNYVRKLL